MATHDPTVTATHQYIRNIETGTLKGYPVGPYVHDVSYIKEWLADPYIPDMSHQKTYVDLLVDHSISTSNLSSNDNKDAPMEEDKPEGATSGFGPTDSELIVDLESEVASLNDEIDAKDNVIDELEEDKGCLIEDFEELKSDYRKLELDTSSLIRRNSELKAELSSLQGISDRLMNEFGYMKI